MIRLPTVWYLIPIILLDISSASQHNNTTRRRSYSPPCPSDIYCHGRLLHTVQMARVFKDSKTFVDRKLVHPPATVRRNFETFMRSVSDHPSEDETRKFVTDNFVSTSLDSWTPQDWTPSPSFLSKVQDSNLRELGRKLNEIWKSLGRKISPAVQQNHDEYSLVYVPNPFMVPGGRFAEFYYWDQFWILKGMLLCEMRNSVRGMIENFLFMVRKFGYVPNGGRIYYERTQPPLLISMVKDYLDATGDWNFVKRNLATLDKEFNFWMKKRTMSVQWNGLTYRLARYNNELTGPRPESYRQDYALAQDLSTEEERDELYINLKSAAESGWDFSSRWFRPKDTTEVGTLRDIKARSIIPVDLNSFLFKSARIMAEFHRKSNQRKFAGYYDNVAARWKKAINDILWDDDLGCWFDFDLDRRKRRTEFYPSNVTPLWAGIDAKVSGQTSGGSKGTADRVLKYLQNSKALSFPGGIPTSMEHTGEQWDFPNGWAPLQHIVVEALRRSESSEAKAMAFDLAQRWVRNNYETFRNSNDTMFEKYDVTSVGSPGGGGEYEVVAGFGWSNGVIIDFINTYADSLSSLS